jgi:hydrogenase maturation protein HypF
MPGGEQAIREPWRMACAWLVEALGEEPPMPRAIVGRVEPDRWRAVAELARTGLASPTTTSMGRLFDAVAVLCGLPVRVSYEGQAAIELEAAADRAERGAYPIPAVPDPAGDVSIVLDARDTVRALAADADRGAPPSVLSARFHNGLAEATASACSLAAAQHGIETVVLSGGVFQNRLLLERTAADLAARGLRVLVPERLPPNDGGIAYGQAAVAASRSA